MQISREARKKIKKFLSFNRPMDSSPRISLKVVFVPALGGGVLGKEKLNNPRTTDRIADRRNVFTNVLFCSQASQPMINPARIQPMVPHTRMLENSFSGLFICLNDTAFTSARVGMYNIIYTSRTG